MNDLCLDHYLRAVAAGRSAVEAHAVLCRFMCRCLPLLDPFLPDIGREASGKAMGYWLNGQGKPGDLEAARVACWKFLEEGAADTNLQDQQVVAVRALLSVLNEEPDGQDFSFDAVEWFVAMLTRLGDFSSAIESQMDV